MSFTTNNCSGKTTCWRLQRFRSCDFNLGLFLRLVNCSLCFTRGRPISPPLKLLLALWLSRSLALYSVGVILRVMTLMYSPLTPGGDGLNPGNAFAVPEHFHAVDGFDDGGIVAQQDMAEPVGVVGGQLELSGDLWGLRGYRRSYGLLRFRLRKTGNSSSGPNEGKTRRQRS